MSNFTMEALAEIAPYVVMISIGCKEYYVVGYYPYEEVLQDDSFDQSEGGIFNCVLNDINREDEDITFKTLINSRFVRLFTKSEIVVNNGSICYMQPKLEEV